MAGVEQGTGILNSKGHVYIYDMVPSMAHDMPVLLYIHAVPLPCYCPDSLPVPCTADADDAALMALS